MFRDFRSAWGSRVTLQNIRADGRAWFFACGGTVVLLQALLGLSQLGSQVPTTAGWFLAAWAHRESLPSSDFPFPDLSVVFEGAVGFLGQDPFWADQLYHLVLWLTFSFVVFVIAARVTRPLTAAIATSGVLTMAFAQPGNLISGYFETHVLLAICGAALLSGRRYSYPMTLVGVSFLTLSVYVKQTGLGAWVALFVVFVTSGRRTQAGAPRPHPLRSFLSAQVLSLLAIWLLYSTLLSTKSLVDVLGQPFKAGGKAVGLRFAPKMVADGLIIFQPTVVWFFGLAVLIILVRVFPQLAAMTPYGLPVLLLLSDSSTETGVVFLALWLFAMYLPYSLGGARRSGFVCFLASASIFAFGAAFVLQLFENFASGPRVFEWTSIYDPANQFLVTSFAACAVGGSVALFFEPSQRMFSRICFDAGPGRLPSLAVWAILGVGLLSGGVTLEGLVLPAVIGASLGIELIVSFARIVSDAQILPQLALGVAALILVVAFGMVRRPYAWYGIDGAPSVAGISPSGEMISSRGEELYDKFQRARLRNVFADFEEQPVLFGSRNIGLSVLDTNVVVDQPCLILWWDVCSEDSAADALELFRRGHFHYAVWTIEPESTVRGNIEYWRSGNVGGIASLNQFFSAVEADNDAILLEFKESLTSDIRTVVVDLRT